MQFQSHPCFFCFQVILHPALYISSPEAHDSPMEIIHFGDIHVWRVEVIWSDLFYPKRYLGGLNLLLNRRKQFPPALGKSVIEEITKQNADLVVFSGDMTTSSLESEFAACAELFEPLQKKWGDHFFVIPGNHDRYTPRSVSKGLYEKYFPYGAMAKNRLRELILDGNRVMIGFDASRPFKIRSNGLLDTALFTDLRDSLQKHREAGRDIILVGHFPAQYPEEVPAKWDHQLIGREKLLSLLDEFQPLAYLHGHKHLRWRIGNQINCGAAGMVSTSREKQAGFVKIKLGEAGIDSVTGFALAQNGKSFEIFTI